MDVQSVVHATRWPRRPAAVALALAASLVGASGCESSRYAMASAEASGFAGRADDRKVVKTAELEVEVDSLEEARAEVERIVAGASGLVEQSRSVEEKRVSLLCRVPSDQLESLMDRIAELGDVTGRSLTKTDVTERWFDLETRLKNSTALRDRLRALLDRASDVDDVVAVEKELTRIQTEVETLQSQFDRLKGQVSLSSLDVTLTREPSLGPLGWIGYGVWWAFRKLFVLD